MNKLPFFRELEVKWIGFALALLISMNASAMAQATPVERWECREYLASNWQTILVTATVDSGRETGTITVAGVTYYTSFEVAGFNRRWDFGPKSHPAQYAFVIKPDGTGLYYDFSTGAEQSRASIVMECRQRGG